MEELNKLLECETLNFHEKSSVALAIIDYIFKDNQQKAMFVKDFMQLTENEDILNCIIDENKELQKCNICKVNIYEEDIVYCETCYDDSILEIEEAINE